MKEYLKALIMLLFFITVILITGCSSMAPESYNSFSYRDSGFNETNITISEKGLSQEQIVNILATRFPLEKTVSIAVIFLYTQYSRSGLPYYIMSEGKNVRGVEKFVPIPRVFIPSRLSFENIQDLGIRSLCEYTLIFYNSSNRTMTFSQFIRGEYKFESDIEFTLIDNQTTAIIASDRLYSSLIKKRDILNSSDIEEAEDEIYTLQAALLTQKLNVLFGSR